VTRAEFFALPLKQFVLEAIKLNELPPQNGAWRSPLWEFTRWMKARTEFTHCGGYNAATMIEEIIVQLVPDGLDPWEYYFIDLPGINDPRAEFIETWDKVRTPANMDALTVAWQAAEQLPLKPTHSYSAKYCALLSIAGHLQRARSGRFGQEPEGECEPWGQAPIALPVERIAELLQCDRKSVSTYLKFARDEGLLTKVSECVPHQRAAEFTFKTECFDWSTGRQVR